jgi:uncharacterized protein
LIDFVLRFLSRQSCRRPWLVLALGAIVALLSIFYAAAELRLNTNTDELMARNRPFAADYRAYTDEFGDLEYIYAVIEDGRDVQRTREAIEFLADRLRQADGVPDVLYVIEPAEQLRIATRAMDDDALRSLSEAADAFPLLVRGEGAAAILGEAQRLLSDTPALGAGTRDPAPHAESRAAEAGAAVFLLRSIAAALPGSVSEAGMSMVLGRDLERQYFSSESGKLHFIRLTPERDYGTLDVIAEPLANIRAVIAEAQAAYPDLAFGLTGKPVLAADEMATSDRDMTRAAILAVALIFVLFMLLVGGFWHPFLAVLALGFGVAWTFGLVTLVIGQLNLLSIVFTVILVGVGIDFGVHIVTRYREQRLIDGGQDIEAAIETTLRTAGRGNVAGAVTSSIAFFAATVTGFQGLRELGIIAGSGLLLCLGAMTLVLPSLLVVFDRHKGSQTLRKLQVRGPQPSRVWDTVVARPATVLAVTLAVTLLIVPGAMRVRFQENLIELQARGVESVEWEHRIMDDSRDTWFASIIAETQLDVRRLTEQAKGLPTVSRVRSVFDLVQPDTPLRDAWRAALHEWQVSTRESTPSESVRASAVRAVAAAVDGVAQASGERDLLELGADLHAIAERLESNDAVVAADMRSRVEAAPRRIGESLAIMLAGDAMGLREALPRAVRDSMMSERGRYLVSFHPVENVWEPSEMREFVAELRTLDPHVTGVPVTQSESLAEMRRAFQMAALLAFLAVFALLIVDLRSLRDATLAMAPLVAGMTWLIALMGLLDIRFNMANFFAVPILFGIGVDSGIHILRRHREEPPTRLNLGSTRRAVFTTAMTSIIGFGMLATASHQGLRSLGIVMALGAALLLVASVVVLPSLLIWLERRQERLRPSDRGDETKRSRRPPIQQRQSKSATSRTRVSAT